LTERPEPEEWRIPQELAAYADFQPSGAGPSPLLIALHGYGGNKKSMARLVRPALPEGFALATLQGPHPHLVRPDDRSRPLGFGFGWITNWRPEESIALHHAAIDAIVRRAAAEGRADPGAVFLLGFSQSVALNFRYAFTFPGKVRGIVAVAGGIPGDWDDEGKYGNAAVDVLYLAGRTDEFYPPERIEGNARALERRGAKVSVEILETGHDFPPEAMPLIRTWLGERAPSAPSSGFSSSSPPSPPGEGVGG
jgi:phospholipase/carboxylesterase